MITANHKARRVNGSMTHWAYYCPGCRHAHVLPVGVTGGPNWTFNGSVDTPTFHPSIRVSVGGYGSAQQERTLCHNWVRDGRIEFLDDSTGHALRGWHDLPDFPPGYGGID